MKKVKNVNKTMNMIIKKIENVKQVRIVNVIMKFQ